MLYIWKQNNFELLLHILDFFIHNYDQILHKEIYFVIGIILSISIRYLHEKNLKLIVVIKLCTTLILRLL